MRFENQTRTGINESYDHESSSSPPSIQVLKAFTNSVVESSLYNCLLTNSLLPRVQLYNWQFKMTAEGRTTDQEVSDHSRSEQCSWLEVSRRGGPAWPGRPAPTATWRPSWGWLWTTTCWMRWLLSPAAEIQNHFNLTSLLTLRILWWLSFRDWKIFFYQWIWARQPGQSQTFQRGNFSSVLREEFKK